MRLVCPSCSAAYDVPDSLLTAGRVVRCARCGWEWTPVAEAPPESAASPPPPLPVLMADAPARFGARHGPTHRPSAMDWLAAHPAILRSRLPLRAAWAASSIILMSAAWGAYAWRAQIVEAWPPSARAYAALGLEPG